MIKYFLSAALSLTLLVAIKGNAAASFSTMTQLGYLQWLVQLSGDTKTLPASPKAPDYVAWATAQGIVPSGGWNPNAVLTRDVLAQTLVQYFNLNVKAGSDAVRALQREGITLPGVSDSSEVTIKDVVNMFNDDGIPARPTVQKPKHSKAKTPTKGNTPPKKETTPRHDNGNNNNDGNNGLNPPGKHTRPNPINPANP